jgi:hypothetical protein
LASALDLVPLVEQALHVALDLLGGDVLGRGAHDHAVLLGLHPVEDRRSRLRSSSGRRLEMP